MALSLPAWARMLQQQPSPRMPALFVAHGSPMNAISTNSFTQALRTAGQALPRPQALLVVSAHWQTRGTYVQASPKPQTIHDFGGFPQALFDMQYPAPGSPAMAQLTIEEGTAHQLLLHPTQDWGLDHGTWSVLTHLYPLADVPVFQLSMDVNLSHLQHLELARALRGLREKGVMMLGSGNIVHTFREVDFRNEAAPVMDFAAEFDQRVKLQVEGHDEAGLTKQDPRDALFRRALPTDEHYLPMLYTMGFSYADEQPVYLYEGFQHGSISMRSFAMAKG